MLFSGVIMAAHGPSESEVKDNLGNVYRLGEELGHGIEGRTHKATVLKIGKKEKNLQLGDKVAIKIQGPTADNYVVEARNRELEVLQKEGTLLGVKRPDTTDPDQSLLIVQPIFPGQDLRKAMYEIKDEHSSVGAKKTMSSEEKDALANSLLNDYFSLQQLGIVHCDIKPDNILYDQASGTAKIIDMGQAFKALNGSPHERFQSPGFLYSPPETEGKNECKNSAQSDMYGLGILIASIYADDSYEANAVEFPKGVNIMSFNSRLNARLALNDVLGESVKHKKGMPDNLLSIVQHLTAISPENRPQNIALARGANEYEGTQAIYASQERAEQFKSSQLDESLRKVLDDKSLPDDFKAELRGAIREPLDLPAIRNELESLKRSFPNSKKTGKEVDKLTSKIDAFTTNESRSIQSIRTDMLQNHNIKNSEKMYVDSIKGFVAMLDSEARQLKSSNVGTPIGGGPAMIVRGPVNTSQLNDAGKMLLLTSKTLANQSDPTIVSESLERLQALLIDMEPKKFGSNAEQTKTKLLTKIDTLIARHEQVKELLPQREPTQTASSKKRQ